MKRSSGVQLVRSATGRCRRRAPRPRRAPPRARRCPRPRSPDRSRSRPTISASSSGGFDPPARRTSRYGSTIDVALELVLAEDREREEEAVRVRVDVAGRPDEVRDVAPPRRVAVDVDRVAEQLASGIRARAPRTSRARARPRLARDVCTASSKRFIAICRKTVAIESSIRPASRLSRRLRVLLDREEALERERLAEDRRRLGRRQRRRRVEEPERLREVRRGARGRARARA